jgi:NAD(P)-dependent dehydrogenase (short-subunit alcohol dehydrogenase family)
MAGLRYEVKDSLVAEVPAQYRPAVGAFPAGPATGEQPLVGKVAFVTGGTRGIGASIATQFAAHGADIAVTYAANESAATGLVDSVRSLGRNARAYKADAANVGAVRSAVEQAHAELGRIDIVVNCAGIVIPGLIDTYSVEDFDRTLNVNVRGAFVTIQAALKYMGRGGRIINIGSIVANRFPPNLVGAAFYSTSKGAITSLTRGLARELGSRDITVNIIQPGPIATEATGGMPEELHATTIVQCAIREYAEPVEIGALAAFLAGPYARHVTGAQFTLDSGFSI